MSVKFPIRGGVFGGVRSFFTAVDDVSFTLLQGRILAVVGESGCGKSTLAKSLVGLVPLSSGSFRIFGKCVSKGCLVDDAVENRTSVRISDVVQMIFQDPFSSLNPRMTVDEILTAPLVARGESREKALARARELLDRVSLTAESLGKFPHEFSGGQRQRLCIARSLMVNPKILLCDEVTSALDVSVQAQILHLLDDLRRELNLSILFISHDMQVVRALSDDVIVMYMGKIVESGPSGEVLSNPKHEYTRRLLDAVPVIRR